MNRTEYLVQQMMNAIQLDYPPYEAYLLAVAKWERIDTKIYYEFDMYY